MAPKQGFVANKSVIGQMLKSDPGVGAALDDIADDMAGQSGGTVESYVTDRQARAVVVSAEAQAIDGVATKAAAATAGRRAGRNQRKGFVSKRQWRRAFAEEVADAEDIAHATEGGYRGLPEQKRKSK